MVPLFGKFVSWAHKKITLIETIETKNCFVSYVMIDGRRYLVKQKKEENKQIAVVRDALAAYVAKDLNIAHKVDVITFDKSIPGKIYSSWPATIHTIAPGDTVRKQRASIYSSLRLKQFWAHADTFEAQGLTHDIITHMTWHKQLPVIVALDLMIGNSDRHCGNLCYDPTTDKFCAIDMDDTFNKDLCEIACKKLTMMIRDSEVIFTQQEISALVQLRQTITYLLRRHKPAQLIKKMYGFAKKSGFIKGSKIYTPSIMKKLNHYALTITQTWVSARKLVVILNQLINESRRRAEVRQGSIDELVHE
jgi:hypothetical protein